VLVVREVGEVDRLMREGVPEGTIGVIDDAGGTMTAPILEEFEGVLCLAGTVRSHLAIISREFGVPVLMGVRMARPLKTGERIRVQYSAEAQNVDAYFGDEVKPRAVVTLLEDA
jgi:phosphohistidine swiveling domain-containing protein